jgi:protein TonB
VPEREAVTPPVTPPAPGSAESALMGRGFSLLPPKLDVPALPRLPGGGGRRPEGEGAGESGHEREGQAAIPLNKPPDADHAEYFLKVKKAIEEHWSYPRAAAEKGQSGQLVLEFVIRKDGNVLVELVRTSGVDILDRYAVNAVKLSAPFPPIPERLASDNLRISASFTYILDHGFRVFGLK